MKTILNKVNLPRITAGIIISILFSVLFGIFAPLELFIGNKNNFWFDFYDILLPLLAVFIGIFVINVIFLFFCSFISHVLYRCILIIEFIAFLCIYIQGNFLVWNLPTIDGSIIDWSCYNKDVFISLALILIVILIATFVIVKVGFPSFIYAIRWISICFILLMTVTLLTEIVNTGGSTLFAKKSDHTVSIKDEMKFSNKKNFIIIIYDRVESSIIEQLYETDPKYSDFFKDFTYYEDAMSIYPRTKYSIPQIYTGREYLNQGGFDQFYLDSMKESPLFKKLKSLDYGLSLYDYELKVEDDFYRDFVNVVSAENTFSSKIKFLKLYYRMIGHRFAPYGIKIIFEADRIIYAFDKLKESEGEYEVYDWDDVPFYNQLVDSDNIELTDDNWFKLVHLEGAHNPIDIDENIQPIKDGKYEQKVRACLTISNALFEKLKAADIYDNSVIVIMSDHGDYHDKTKLGRNPWFCVKGIGEKHEQMQVNEAPVSYEDLQEAFSRLLDGASSDEIFDCKEGDKRVRRFFFYEDWDTSDHMYGYTQSGKANDMDTFVSTGDAYIAPENEWVYWEDFVPNK